MDELDWQCRVVGKLFFFVVHFLELGMEFVVRQAKDNDYRCIYFLFPSFIIYSAFDG